MKKRYIIIPLVLIAMIVSGIVNSKRNFNSFNYTKEEIKSMKCVILPEKTKLTISEDRDIEKFVNMVNKLDLKNTYYHIKDKDDRFEISLKIKGRSSKLKIVVLGDERYEIDGVRYISRDNQYELLNDFVEELVIKYSV